MHFVNKSIEMVLKICRRSRKPKIYALNRCINQYIVVHNHGKTM